MGTDSALCIQGQKEREKPETGHPLRQTKGLPSPLPHVKQQQAEIQAQKINTHSGVTDRYAPSSARKVPNCFWQVCVFGVGGTKKAQGSVTACQGTASMEHSPGILSSRGKAQESSLPHHRLLSVPDVKTAVPLRHAAKVKNSSGGTESHTLPRRGSDPFVV